MATLHDGQPTESFEHRLSEPPWIEVYDLHYSSRTQGVDGTTYEDPHYRPR